MRQACPARRPVVNKPFEMRPASAWTLQGEVKMVRIKRTGWTHLNIRRIWLHVILACLGKHSTFATMLPIHIPPLWWSSFGRFQLWLAWCELSRRDLPINQKGHQEPHQHWTCYPNQPQIKAWDEMRGRLTNHTVGQCTKSVDIFKLTCGSGASPPPLPWQSHF